jgi:diaminopimelate epimerase
MIETKPKNEGSFLPTNNYEAAGNKFYILERNQNSALDKDQPKNVKQIFESSLGIDSVLIIEKIADNKFLYLVAERDGSFSEMCGNGARAVAKYLKDNRFITSDNVTLVTRNGREVGVIIEKLNENTSYIVNLGVVSSIDQDPEFFKEYIDPKYFEKNTPSEKYTLESEKYLKNPEKLRDLFPDHSILSNYDSYFLNLLQRVENNKDVKEEFFCFLNNLEAKEILQAGGEPHMLLNITDMSLFLNLESAKRDVYLKLTSFIFRSEELENGEKIYPKSMNFMFYGGLKENSDGSLIVNMFPSERGVHNDVKYDQTGACGTGSSCLGKYLFMLKPNSKKVTVVNRSGEGLEITQKDGNIYLKGSAEETILTDSSSKCRFTTQVMIEKRHFFGGNDESLESTYSNLTQSKLERLKTLRESANRFVYTTSHHPNFFPPDAYAVLSLLTQAEVANSLNKKAIYSMLETTNDKMKTKIVPNILDRKQNMMTELLKGLVESEDVLSVENVIEGFCNRLLETRDGSLYKEGKEIVMDQIEPSLKLDMWLGKDQFELLKNQMKDLNDSLPVGKNFASINQALYKVLNQEAFKDVKNDQFSKTLTIRFSIYILEPITAAVREYSKILRDNPNLTHSQKTFQIQTLIKNRIIEGFINQTFTTEQHEVMQKVGLESYNHELVNPRLLSMDGDFKALVIDTISSVGLNLFEDYMKNSLEEGKERKFLEIKLPGEEDFVLISVKKIEDKIHYNAPKLKNKDLDLRQIIYDYFGKNIKSSPDINLKNIGAIYGDLSVITYASLGLTQLGSERDLRSKFLEFASLYGDDPVQKKFYHDLHLKSRGFECDTYDPRNYHKVDPSFYAGSDHITPEEHITLLSMMGTKVARFEIQELLRDDHVKPHLDETIKEEIFSPNPFADLKKRFGVN